MNKVAFAAIFHEALDAACSQAETKFARKLGRDVMIKMYGAGKSGAIVSPGEFVSLAYISDTVFYRLIDLAVVETIGSSPVVFARISGHPPGSLSKCWNGDKGPFKQLVADTLIQR